MAATGRPRIEYDKKAFEDLVGLGCTQEEILWWFRDERGKAAALSTLSRWCKRTYGMTFEQFREKNGGMAFRIKLRRNQIKLSEKSAAMAIFLGKNYLRQSDTVKVESRADGLLADLIDGLKEPEDDIYPETESADGPLAAEPAATD